MTLTTRNGEITIKVSRAEAAAWSVANDADWDTAWRAAGRVVKAAAKDAHMAAAHGETAERAD